MVCFSSDFLVFAKLEASAAGSEDGWQYTAWASEILSLAASPDLVSDTCRDRAVRLCSNHQQRSRAMFEFCRILTGFEARSIWHLACRVGAIVRRNTAEFPAAVPTLRKSLTPHMIHETGGAIAMEKKA